MRSHPKLKCEKKTLPDTDMVRCYYNCSGERVFRYKRALVFLFRNNLIVLFTKMSSIIIKIVMLWLISICPNEMMLLQVNNNFVHHTLSVLLVNAITKLLLARSICIDYQSVAFFGLSMVIT